MILPDLRGELHTRIRQNPKLPKLKEFVGPDNQTNRCYWYFGTNFILEVILEKTTYKAKSTCTLKLATTSKLRLGSVLESKWTGIENPSKLGVG